MIVLEIHLKHPQKAPKISYDVSQECQELHKGKYFSKPLKSPIIG